MKRIWSLLVAGLLSASLVSAETAKTTLKIEGMTCGGCVPTVNVQLKKTVGVVAYEVRHYTVAPKPSSCRHCSAADAHSPQRFGASLLLLTAIHRLSLRMDVGRHCTPSCHPSGRSRCSAPYDA